MRVIFPIIAALLAGCGIDPPSVQTTAVGAAIIRDDQSPPPYCEGRDLSISQLQAAQEFAYNFCASQLPSSLEACYAEFVANLCYGDCAGLLCGEQLPLYYQCLEETGQGIIPWYCWELTGWDL